MVKDEIIDIIKIYVNALKSKNIIPDKVILFGSNALGTADQWSDIDIAIVSKKFGINRFKERILLTKIACKINPRIEPHPVGLVEFEKESWKTFIHEIKSTGIEIAA